MTLLTPPTTDLPQISFNDVAKDMRLQAMLKATEIESVSDEASQALAVEAQTALAEVISQIEKSRVAFKAPYLDTCRLIDRLAADFVANLKEQLTRISGMVGNFQANELAKQRAVQAAANEELTRLEREREAQKATAATIEEREAINERYNQEVAAAQSVVRPVPRVAGQIVKPDIDFEITDLRALAQNHWHLVNVSPKRSEIKAELKLGRALVGVKAWEVVSSSVRVKTGKELVA